MWVSGVTEKREFQAETRMLLDIVAKSLYSEKEVSFVKAINIHFCIMFCMLFSRFLLES